MFWFGLVWFGLDFGFVFAHVKKPIQKTGRVEEPARRKGEMEAWQLICSEHPTPHQEITVILIPVNVDQQYL